MTVVREFLLDRPVFNYAQIVAYSVISIQDREFLQKYLSSHQLINPERAYFKNLTPRTFEKIQLTHKYRDQKQIHPWSAKKIH